MNARTGIFAILFFILPLSLSCGGKLYDVAPLPGTAPVISAGDPGGLRIGAKALSGDEAFELFSANLPLAGVMAVEIELSNDAAESINTRNLKFELRDSAGAQFKRISSKNALSRVMDYYGVSFYRKDARNRTRDDYAAVEFKTDSPLGVQESRRGYMFFQSKVESAAPAGLILNVTGYREPLSLQIEQKPVTLGSVYYPEPGDRWKRKKPEEVGMDALRLGEAIAFAQANETRRPRDFSDQETIFGKLLGPIPDARGGTNGIVIRHGYIVAEFGETDRVEPTYSAAKSFLSTILGLALDRGLIRDANDPVRKYINDGGYDSERNSKITWHHHAQQTSEWEGELFGKIHTFIGETEFGRGMRQPREMKEPGTFYEYNDVRINRFSLSLLRVWKKPLPEVLKEEVMDKIGASAMWKYLPYKNSEVEVDGKKMMSVSGGTRWGGGLWINTRDEARFGYLFLRRGKWGDEQVISEKWVGMALTPGTHGPDYGYLWWLNTQGKQWPDAPKSSFAAVGFGSNTIWVDPEHDLVVVWRWHQGNGNEFFKRVIAAINE